MKFSGVIFWSLLLMFYYSCDEGIEIPIVEISEKRVDLRARQTSIKNQGARGSCIVFASVAAVEAAYKRFGAELDLSEEFVNYMGKNLWLHHKNTGLSYWSEIEANGPDASENQLSWTSGGSGAGYIQDMLLNGLKIPEENKMPYHFNLFTYQSSPNWIDFSEDLLQKSINNFNLDSVNIRHDLLHADKFYGVGQAVFYEGDDAADTDLIESILKQGYEVVWDALVSHTVVNGIWFPDSNPSSAHSMLIVGFDKTDPNPDKHYFIVKNSWGYNNEFTDATGEDGQGFTYISYKMVRERGYNMAYIKAAKFPINGWSDLRFIGKYDLLFDGFQARLDIYHIPGYWKASQLGMPDRRLGTLYIGDTAYRVNGEINNNKITFYFDDANRNMDWQTISGRKFEYYFSSSDYMAGFHTDTEGGVKYPGYARKAGLWPAGSQTPRPFSIQSYIYSKWDLYINKRKITITLNNLEPAGGNNPSYYDIKGNYTEINNGFTITGAPNSVHFRINALDFREVNFQIQLTDGQFSSHVLHLNNSPGTMAGNTTGGLFGQNNPCVLVRLN